MRSLAQTAFVDEDQDAPFPEGFFLRARPPLLLPVLDLLFVAFPGSSLRPLRAPAQADQKLPDMALVIAHAELLLDQVGHTRAGPQRGFIAQPLGTCEQKLSLAAAAASRSSAACGPHVRLSAAPTCPGHDTAAPSGPRFDGTASPGGRSRIASARSNRRMA